MEEGRERKKEELHYTSQRFAPRKKEQQGDKRLGGRKYLAPQSQPQGVLHSRLDLVFVQKKRPDRKTDETTQERTRKTGRKEAAKKGITILQTQAIYPKSQNEQKGEGQEDDRDEIGR